MLNLFTQPSQLARVHRNLLSRLLDDHRGSLSPAAISLMEPSRPRSHRTLAGPPLAPVGIRPRTLWIRGAPGKGYFHKDFLAQKLTVNA